MKIWHQKDKRITTAKEKKSIVMLLSSSGLFSTYLLANSSVRFRVRSIIDFCVFFFRCSSFHPRNYFTHCCHCETVWFDALNGRNKSSSRCFYRKRAFGGDCIGCTKLKMKLAFSLWDNDGIAMHTPSMFEWSNYQSNRIMEPPAIILQQILCILKWYGRIQSLQIIWHKWLRMNCQ